MQTAPRTDDEEVRLALLAACGVLHTPAEQAFDDVARLAADLTGAEIALITFIADDYQWFKARVGTELDGTPRDVSFCGHCIAGRGALVVEDTHEDPRFADNPLVTGTPYIRSYVGVPLFVDGVAVGALSVAGLAPRRLSARELQSLERLAAQVSKELRLRRDLARATQPDAAVPEAVGDEVPIGVGSLVGGTWRVTRELGRGGVGAVFEARDPAGERVALKVLLPMWARSPGLLERFAREARVLMKVRSPHVNRLIDVGNLDGDKGALPYLVLELLEGVDLARVLARGRLPWRKALAWCADACEGVAAAHDVGVVHRDLKPSNLFLAGGERDDAVVKVLDFGIAAGDPVDAGMKVTAVDDVLGSPAYMSPEQMMGTAGIDARSDVWSMGACVYELITDAWPFPGRTPFEVFANALARPPVPIDEHVAGVPEEVQAIVSRCLLKLREDRWPSMRELGAALRAAAKR